MLDELFPSKMDTIVKNITSLLLIAKKVHYVNRALNAMQVSCYSIASFVHDCENLPLKL